MNRTGSLKAKALENFRTRCSTIPLLQYNALQAYSGTQVHNIRRAHVISHMMENFKIEIDDDELIVGKHPLMAFTEKERKEIGEASAYLRKAGYIASAKCATTNHRVPDIEKLLHKGIEGVLDEIEEQKTKLNMNDGANLEKAYFLEAAKTALHGFKVFGERYRVKLGELCKKEENPRRKRELGELRDVFLTIPSRPARTFYEAIQCAWFMQFTFTAFEDASLTGRPDNYLYPFYKKDIESGVITKEFAFELIENLYFKSNELNGTWPASLMVGGVDRQGNTICNELTSMFLDAIATTGLVNPSVALCYNKNIPDEILEKCVDLVAKGYTRPAIFNDDIIIKGLMQSGVSQEDARCYIHSTCVEITPIGASHIMVGAPYINVVKSMEYLFNDGKSLHPDDAGNIYETKTPYDIDELKTFDAFYAKIKEILSCMFFTGVQLVNEESYNKSRYTSAPLVSCFTNDCIKKGKDVGNEGARYRHIYPCLPGFSTLVDSINAIKDVVYEKRMMSLRKLKNVLISNYENDNSLHKYLINTVPKYCNNNDQADETAVDLYNFIKDDFSKYTNPVNGKYYASYFSHLMHGVYGKISIATADGRLAETAVSESLGPVQGMDKNGPTAVINSVTKTDHTFGIGGIAVNLRFGKSFIGTPGGKSSVVSLIKSFMEQGGFELQFNVVDRETLIEAQKSPEKFPTLMVRVAGYSDYFTRIPPEVQNEIISRTEHSAV